MRHQKHRIFDLTLVIASAPIWMPLLALTAALVRLVDGPPVIFRQERVGRAGQIFLLLKFRTMRVSRRERFGPPDPADVTPLGRVLRATSLDELPQLFNVLRGEMAIVGPRPVRPAHLERSSRFAGERLTVRPGVTGLAQARGRNDLTWDEKLDLDEYYVRHQSLRLDIQVLAETLINVARRRGIDSHKPDPLGTTYGPGRTGRSE